MNKIFSAYYLTFFVGFLLGFNKIFLFFSLNAKYDILNYIFLIIPYILKSIWMPYISNLQIKNIGNNKSLQIVVSLALIALNIIFIFFQNAYIYFLYSSLIATYENIVTSYQYEQLSSEELKDSKKIINTFYQIGFVFGGLILSIINLNYSISYIKFLFLFFSIINFICVFFVSNTQIFKNNINLNIVSFTKEKNIANYLKFIFLYKGQDWMLLTSMWHYYRFLKYQQIEILSYSLYVFFPLIFGGYIATYLIKKYSNPTLIRFILAVRFLLTCFYIYNFYATISAINLLIMIFAEKLIKSIEYTTLHIYQSKYFEKNNLSKIAFFSMYEKIFSLFYIILSYVLIMHFNWILFFIISYSITLFSLYNLKSI